jgi:hypothetical protein
LFFKSLKSYDCLEVNCKDCSKQRKNKDIKQQYDKSYRSKNKQKISEWQKNYRSKPEVKKIRNLKEKYLRDSNINYKLTTSLRNRIRDVIARNSKSDSTIKLLGCSIEDFKLYLSSKFTNRMNWENYGINGWHIDHIIPCSSFNFSDLEQQKKCFHYTNLQPLWATREIAMSYGEGPDYIGNLEKSDKL